MSLKTFDPAIVEALCIWQTLRGLGFAPEEVYCSIEEDDDANYVLVTLEAQEKELDFEAGQSTLKADELAGQWQAIGEAFDTDAISEEEGNQAYADSLVSKNLDSMIQAIIESGIVLEEQDEEDAIEEDN
jgi:hypothetical protein